MALGSVHTLALALSVAAGAVDATSLPSNGARSNALIQMKTRLTRLDLTATEPENDNSVAGEASPDTKPNLTAFDKDHLPGANSPLDRLYGLVSAGTATSVPSSATQADFDCEEKKAWCCRARQVGCAGGNSGAGKKGPAGHSSSGSARSAGSGASGHAGRKGRTGYSNGGSTRTAGSNTGSVASGDNATSVAHVDFDCEAGHSSWKRGWFEEKKEWCCRIHQMGCASDISGGRATSVGQAKVLGKAIEGLSRRLEEALTTSTSTSTTTATGPSPRANAWVPPLMVATIALGILLPTLAAVRRYSERPERRICIVQMVALLSGNLTYTLVIPSSYFYAQVVGHGAAYSGLLIGVLQTGALAGAVLTWLGLHLQPGIWRSRSLLLAAVGCHLAGALLYCVASFALGAHAYQRWLDGLDWLLCFARFVDGLGLGVVLQVGQVALVHLFPSAERPGWMATNQLFAMLGISMGPVLASMAVMVKICDGEWERVEAVGTCYVGIAFGTFLTVLVMYPSAASACEDYQVAPCTQDPAGPASGARRWSRMLVIFAVVAMTGARALIVSGLEAATALLLQTEYLWGHGAIGVAIGVSFLAIIPLKLAHSTLQDRLPLATWIRLPALAALLGAVLLIPRVVTACGMGGWSRPFSLLLADGILFSSIFLGDALTTGLLMTSEHQYPSGSWLDANHIVLYRELVKGIGRSAGPPWARITVNSGGQGFYARQQLLLVGSFIVLLEALVIPTMRGE